MNEKSKSSNQSNPDPYEEMVRLEKLDAYESLIRSNFSLKETSNSID